MFRFIAGTVIALIGGVAVARAALDPTESAIAQQVAAGQPAAEALLARAVDIESPTENLAGVRAVGEVFAEELRAIGFRTRWVELPADMKRAGHLVATIDGTRGQRLLLLGHLDTVLAGERFRREGDRAYGTGTSDMKGGIAAALAAVDAFETSRGSKTPEVRSLQEWTRSGATDARP